MQNLLSSILLTKNIKVKIYRTVIWPFVFYGCETWSLTLREKCSVRVFENRVLRRILGLRGRSNKEWRKLHNEEFNNLSLTHNIFRVIKSRRMRLAGHVACIGERKDVYRV